MLAAGLEAKLARWAAAGHEAKVRAMRVPIGARAGRFGPVFQSQCSPRKV